MAMKLDQVRRNLGLLAEVTARADTSAGIGNGDGKISSAEVTALVDGFDVEDNGAAPLAMQAKAQERLDGRLPGRSDIGHALQGTMAEVARAAGKDGKLSKREEAGLSADAKSVVTFARVYDGWNADDIVPTQADAE